MAPFIIVVRSNGATQRNATQRNATQRNATGQLRLFSCRSPYDVGGRSRWRGFVQPGFQPGHFCRRNQGVVKSFPYPADTSFSLRVSLREPKEGNGAMVAAGVLNESHRGKEFPRTFARVPKKKKKKKKKKTLPLVLVRSEQKKKIKERAKKEKKKKNVWLSNHFRRAVRERKKVVFATRFPDGVVFN
ncbi:uncharacterized protein LOC143153233 [Ptiloglossa arizonensis]|uniref:uncharacterized protein LOC143153233 n=1 Tax=Ptiloglossa arizonensis TaxID=3350558 RepID=UPI003F9FBE73